MKTNYEVLGVWSMYVSEIWFDEDGLSHYVIEPKDEDEDEEPVGDPCVCLTIRELKEMYGLPHLSGSWRLKDEEIQRMASSQKRLCDF